jgi:hypothetical protein
MASVAQEKILNIERRGGTRWTKAGGVLEQEKVE